jgi:hypothetical protein
MNAHDLTETAGEDAAEDDQRPKSAVRATRGLAQLLGLEAEPPPWSEAPPTPLLPHDPRVFEAPPPYPDAAEVLAAVAAESLSSGLVKKLF